MGFHALIINSFFCFNTFNNIKSVLSIIVMIPIRIMENQGANQLEVLSKRLSEAERRAKILKLEVKSIRQEIAALQQSTVSIVAAQNANTNNHANIANSHNRLRTSRQTILLDSLPSTSSVDGPESNKRPADDEGTSQNKKSRVTFNKEDEYVIVYTDGSCENNGKPNAKAGIGVWFGDAHPSNVSKPVDGRATNNTAEIQACVQALQVVKDHGINKVKIFTDSQFTINCITKWIKKWKTNNWKLTSGGAVKNKEDLQKLEAVLGSFTDVKWVHVAGHNGIKGNEEADKLARQGAQSYRPPTKH